MVPEIARPEIRKLIWRKYRVIYRIDKSQVTVLLFQHGKRLLDAGGLENT